MNPLAGYDFCKSFIAVHSPDGTQINYQMKLTIIKGAGVSSAGVLYLDNKSTNWPLDIRFTKVDGVTLLDFWREESDATDGTWWIEIDSIPDPADFTGYVHVGDADAADASNGDTTFLFFDHFPGVAVNTDKWTVTGTPTVASSICQLLVEGGAREDILSKTFGAVNTAVRLYLKSKHFNNVTNYEAAGDNSADNYQHWAQFCHSTTPSYSAKYMSYQTAALTTPMVLWSADTYHILDVIRNDTTNVIFKTDDNVEAIHTTQLNTAKTMGPFCTVYSVNDSEIDIDWALMRTCTINEPTWGAWGDWEGGGGATSIRNKFFRRDHIKRMQFFKTLKLK